MEGSSIDDLLQGTSGWHNSSGSSSAQDGQSSLPALGIHATSKAVSLPAGVQSSDAASSIHPQAFITGDSESALGQAEAELEELRRRVDQTLSEKDSHALMGPKFGDLVQRALALRSQLDDVAATNRQLQSNHRFTRMQMELASREQLWIQLEAGHMPAPLARQARLLAPPQGARPASCGAQVSVTQLPAPDAWDRGWCAVVRGLQTLDVLLMHRQFLQRCSLLVPRAEKPGGYAPVRHELDQLCSRYQTYTQQLMRLAPEPWNDSLNYSLDTLEPLQEPLTSQSLMRRGVIDFWSPTERRVLAEIQARFAQVFAQLRQRQAVLQQRLHNLCGSSARSRAECFPSEPLSVEASEVTRLLEENLRQQKFQHRTFIHTVNTSIPAMSMIQMRLSVYPGALNGQLTGLPQHL